MSIRRSRLCRADSKIRDKADEVYSKVLSIVLESNLALSPFKNLVLGKLRARDYKGLLDFADELGDTVYFSAAQHYAAHQLAALIKKYPFKGPIEGVDPEKKALEKFAKAEHLCKRYNLIFRLERKLNRTRSLQIRTKMRRWIRSVLGDEPSYASIWALCDFTPGASVGVSGNATHLAAKLLAPGWSVSPTALPYALASLRSNAQIWELLLKQEGPHYSYDPILFEEKLYEKAHKVTYNKIALVPKTAKVHRTIAVEPFANSFIQKGVDEFIRRRLYRFGIDLKDQTRNQELARLGSIQDDDPFCTIDLQNASDSISSELVRDLLPPSWFHFLNAIRSFEYKINGTLTKYHKFCSMGNGFCFPLETLIFASVCVAVYEKSSRAQDFSVYGDDIIVRQSLAEEVLQNLRLLGFRHNPEKTFLKGPFRESCGADWFQGEDVRPVTLDYKFDSLENIFKFHNLTLRKEKSSIFFQEAREYLRTIVPKEHLYVRPYQSDVQTAFEVPMDKFMASPFASFDRSTWSWRWKELVSTSRIDTRYREKHGWSTVLVIAALRGASSLAPFTLRRNARTRVRLISHHGGHATWLPSPSL